MAQIDPSKFYSLVEKSLETQNFDPLFLFFGEEPYLIKQALHYIKTCALYGVGTDFNFSSYMAGVDSISNVRDEVETLPMMASRRVVILREVQEMSDKDWDLLAPLIASPVSSTVFILVGSKLDKRKKIMKTLFEKAVVAEFKKPFENQIPGWIVQICKANEMTIREDAIQLLHRLAGSQLLEIEAEVKKLREFLGQRTEIELEDVAQCVSRRREENVFQFAETIAKGDKSQALMQLAQLLDQGQNEIGVVSLVARHFRLLLMVKQGMDQGMSGQRLAQFAQVPPYFVGEYVNQSKSWTSRRLEQALLLTFETEKALKSSPVSAPIWLENMVFRA